MAADGVNACTALLFDTNDVLEIIKPENYLSPAEDLKRLQDGLIQGRPVNAQLAASPDKPDANTLNLARELITAMADLLENMKMVDADLNAIVDRRGDAKC